MAPWRVPSVITLVILQLTVRLNTISVMCEIPIPVNVNVNSSNFIHLLTWDPGPSTPKDVYYNVTFTSERGGSWEPVTGCEHVQTPLVCNVTKAFSERHLVYYNQITAVLGEQVSGAAHQKGFKPIADTSLDPPLLSVEACGRELCVGLEPPVSYLKDLYESFVYILTISSGHEQVQVMQNVRLSGETLRDLAPGRMYCVSVRISANLDRKESANGQPQCAFTASVHTRHFEMSGGLILIVLIACCVGVLLKRAGFLCLKTFPPLCLTSLRHSKQVSVVVPWDALPCSPVRGAPSSPASVVTESDEELTDRSVEDSETEGASGGGYELRRATSSPTPPSPSLSQVGPLAGVPRPLDPLSGTAAAPRPYFPPSEGYRLDEPASASAGGVPCGAEAAAWDRGASRSQRPVLRVPTRPKTGAVVPAEEEIKAEERSGEVNLLSVTLGGREDEQQEEEATGVDVAEKGVATFVPSRSMYIHKRHPAAIQNETTVDLEEEMVEEGEEDDQDIEHPGYMSR